jgi:hypothetical protein
MQILKICRVLGAQWIASIFWSVMAVWQDYKALVLHFEEAKKLQTGTKRRDAFTKVCLEKLHQLSSF